MEQITSPSGVPDYSLKHRPSKGTLALRRIREYTVIILLTAIYAASYDIFVFGNQFAPAGINGVATMIQELLGVSVGYISIIINIPLCIAAFFIVGRPYAIRSFIVSVTFSLMLILLHEGIFDLSALRYVTNNGTSTVLAPIAAGTLAGIITAYIMKNGGSTGGTDVIAAIVHHYRPDYNLMGIIFAFNTIVALLSYFVYGFKFEPVICSILYSFATSQLGDHFLLRGNRSIRIEVITNHAEEIARRVMTDLRHSVTMVEGKGMYSQTEKQILICVIGQHQILRFQKIIRDYPDTFAVISSVNQVCGRFEKSK